MWKSWKDVESDFIKYSQYSIPQNEECSVPETILNYRKTIENNAKTGLHSDLNESRTYVVSGRGKGIKDRLIRPGEPFERHPLDDIELKKSIREVSGLGYSNDFIEKTVKNRMEEAPKEPEEDSIVPNFEWTHNKPIYKAPTIAIECNPNDSKRRKKAEFKVQN